MSPRFWWITSVILGVIIISLGGVLWWFTDANSPARSEVKRQIKMEKILSEQDKELSRIISATSSVGIASALTTTTTTSTAHKIPAVKDMKIGFGILMYHYIGDMPPHTPKNAQNLHVTAEHLEQQIKYLLAKGYHFVTLNEVYDMFIKDGTAPPKTLVLTFDDGYRSFYTNVFPILKKYQVKASAYIISQDIGHKGNVTWDMLKEISKSGLVEIGDHTVNHKSLKKLSDDEQRFQMGQNKKDLEDGLGITVNTIVYPFGEYNTSTKRIAEEIGFKGGAAVYNGKHPSRNDLFNWRRVQIQNKDVGDGLIKVLYGAFEVVQ